jgi:hypothetical protein
MRLSRWAIAFWALLAVVAGCGGNSGSITNPHGTSVTVAIPAVTSSVAVQIGSGNFMPATVQNGRLTFFVPDGTTKYAIALSCQVTSGQNTQVGFETIFEATTQDVITNSPSCLPSLLPNAPRGLATGNVNASAVPGATNVQMSGNDDIPSTLGEVSGPFTLALPTGANDVGVVAVDGSFNVLAAKIVRSQTVPGAINGGIPIVFGPGDATTLQSLSVNSVPAGYAVSSVGAKYATANGAALILKPSLPLTTQYAGFPASATQPGDYYLYAASADVIGHEVSVEQSTANANLASSITLPAPWASSSPTPAALPTFTVDYTGFNGMASVTYSVFLNWGSFQTINVIATKNFIAGSTTMTVPNLTSLSGFPLSPPSGTLVVWQVSIQGATVPNFTLFPQTQAIPANNSVLTVRGNGEFSVP